MRQIHPAGCRIDLNVVKVLSAAGRGTELILVNQVIVER